MNETSMTRWGWQLWWLELQTRWHYDNDDDNCDEDNNDDDNDIKNNCDSNYDNS